MEETKEMDPALKEEHESAKRILESAKAEVAEKKAMPHNDGKKDAHSTLDPWTKQIKDKFQHPLPDLVKLTVEEGVGQESQNW
jgi:hypothetical protein